MPLSDEQKKDKKAYYAHRLRSCAKDSKVSILQATDLAFDCILEEYDTFIDDTAVLEFIVAEDAKLKVIDKASIARGDETLLKEALEDKGYTVEKE